jgi:hypothetical protein
VEDFKLRIIGAGHLLRMQSILSRMQNYVMQVRDILEQLPGLRRVEESIICPRCLLVHRSHPGSFPVDMMENLLTCRNEQHGDPAMGLLCLACRVRIPLSQLAYVTDRSAPRIPTPYAVSGIWSTFVQRLIRQRPSLASV